MTGKRNVEDRRMKGKKRRKGLFGIIGVLALVMSIAFIQEEKTAADEMHAEDGQICDGIFIDGIDVSGMTCEEAEAEYEAYLTDLQKIELVFQLEDESCTVAMADLELEADLSAAIKEAYSYGRRGNLLKRYKEIMEVANEKKEIPVNLSMNEEYLIQYLNESLADYIIPAQNASLEYADGTLSVVEGKSGKELNAEETIDKLMNAVRDWSGKNKLTIEVATNELKPEHTAEELEAVQDVLGEFDTSYSSGDVSRNNNIMNAASKINGSIIYPGEEFDTMAHLLPFTTENGWSYAGAYLNGEVISDIGGGICQVSTTLYNAVLQAELEVSERHPHSMAVGYVQLSADAALNEGTKNFRFVNNTDNPIYIFSYASGGTMHVTIFGKEYRDAGRTIEYKNEILSVIPAGDPIETVDEALPADYREVTQTAHTGYRANLWKNVYENGELVDTVLVNTSYYSASPERVTIGKPEEPAAEAAATPETPASTEAPVSESPSSAAPSTEGPSTETPILPTPSQ